MNERWLEFTVRITPKHNFGSFGIRHERLGEFRFCAQSREDAIAIAGPFTKGATRSISTEKLVEVAGCVPVRWEEVELARLQSAMRQTGHLRSIHELKSEIDELEWSLAL